VGKYLTTSEKLLLLEVETIDLDLQVLCLHLASVSFALSLVFCSHLGLGKDRLMDKHLVTRVKTTPQATMTALSRQGPYPDKKLKPILSQFLFFF
jgi:hypothetical protein